MKSAKDGIFTCKIFRRQLRAYIDNELSETVKANFIAHASQCDECNRSLSEMEEVVKILANIKPVTASKEFDFTFKTRVLLEKERLTNPIYRFSLYLKEKIRYFLAVPAFALAVFAFIFFYTDLNDNFHPGNKFRNVSTFTDSQNGIDLIREDENNADEIVYVYYVLETVQSADIEVGNFMNNNQTSASLQPAKKTFNTAFNTVSF